MYPVISKLNRLWYAGSHNL